MIAVDPKDPSGGKVPPVPNWAREWYNEKLATSLSPDTLQNYVWTLKVLNIDIPHSTLAEIRGRLAECAGLC